MPLIVEDTLHEGLMLRNDVSPVYISVDSKYLSRQYETTILGTYWVEGEILEVSKVLDTLSDEERRVFEEHVVERAVRFYLLPAFLVGYDSLYFDRDSWSILRDAGVFPREHKLRVKLFRLIIEPEGKAITLYPYRDIVAK